MTDDVAIRVSNVSKEFSLNSGSGATLKRIFIDLIKGRRRDKFTALSNLSFTVNRGETLGIIGSNGAGKSTLLSIIAGTMAPTRGTVQTQGIVSSLLELGAGFHPDLTGRENVYLYGSIMGIPSAVMRKRFDDIVDFAGLGKFIDEPVRFYSSGMYVRLGFAVAVQVDPDILLIDEVLAVGDADFQKRCLSKMDEFRKMGKSLLIISHDLNTIRSISDKILFLEHGQIKGIGAPDDLVSQYCASSLREREGMAQREWGTGEAKLTKISLTDKDGQEINKVLDDAKIRVRIDFEAAHRIETPTFGFSISDSDGRIIFGSNSELEGFNLPYIDGKGSISFVIDAISLREGNYMLSFSLHSRDHKTNYHRLENHTPIYLPHSRIFDGMCSMPVQFSCGDKKSC